MGSFVDLMLNEKSHHIPRPDVGKTNETMIIPKLLVGMLNCGWKKHLIMHLNQRKLPWDSNRKQWVEYSGTCFAKGFLPDGITFWEYLCSISLCTRWFCSISPCTRWSVSIGKFFIGNDFMIYLVLKYGIILTFLFKIFS